MRTPYPTFGSGRGFRHPGPRYCSPQRASVRQEVFSAPILEASAPQPCSSTLCDCRAQSQKLGPTTVLTTTRPEPGESTRQTSGDSRRNPGAAAVGLSSRFRQSELSHQQCPARSGAQVPAPELVQVGYLPADFGARLEAGVEAKTAHCFCATNCHAVPSALSPPDQVIVLPSVESDANDVDRFSVAFLSLLDGVLVNALHRDHGIAEIPFEGRFRSTAVQNRTGV